MAGQSISKGALVLTTDAAALQSGLKEATHAIEAFSHKVLGLFGLHLGFEGLKHVIEQIKEMGEQSQDMLLLSKVFDVNVEKMQSLSMATKLAGLETEDLTKALRKAATAFPDEADPVASLMRAFKELSEIEDVNKRIAAAGDIFGGKAAIKTLKIMEADVPKLAEQVKGLALSEHQLEMWHHLAREIELIELKVKKTASSFLTDFIFGGDKGTWEEQLEKTQEKLSEIQKEWKGINNVLSESHAKLIEEGFSESELHDLLNKEIKLRKEMNALQGDAVHLQTEIRKRDQAKNIADAAKAAEKLQNDMNILAEGNQQFVNQDAVARLDHLNKIVESLEKVDPLVEFRQQFEALNELFDKFQRTPEQYANAVNNLKKAIEATGEAAQEVRLPGAAFRGSVEDISTSIRASVGTENNRSAEANRLLEEIAGNTRPLRDVGVED